MQGIRGDDTLQDGDFIAQLVGQRDGLDERIRSDEDFPGDGTTTFKDCGKGVKVEFRASREWVCGFMFVMVHVVKAD